MENDNSKANSSMLRPVLASFVAVLLTGVAIIVSANTQVPRAAGPQRLLALSGTAPSLSTEQLKNKALVGLSVRTAAKSIVMPHETMGAARLQQGNLNQSIAVNTFLSAQRVNSQSQLVALQIQRSFDELDSGLFDNNIEANRHLGTYAGVGFPHIETNARSDADRYKPYKPLLSFTSNKSGDIVPHVKCMGLSPQSVAKRAEKYHAEIYKLAVKHNVSVSLVKAVVAKESCFNPSAVSYVGAIGLMQLMPETARWLKVEHPENPQQNLAGGVRYLAQLRKRFGSNELALAAYNAGPGNVERYNGIPPFDETQNYVRDVLYFYRGYVATTRFLNAQIAI